MLCLSELFPHPFLFEQIVKMRSFKIFRYSIFRENDVRLMHTPLNSNDILYHVMVFL